MNRTVEVKDGVMTLPDEIIKMYDLKPGDEVEFIPRDDGSVELKFHKMREVEIDLPDEDIFTLMKMAHERDITFNKLVEDILVKEMNKWERKICVKDLEDNFDEVFDNVEKGVVYTIYEDKELLKPLAKIIPYEQYERLVH